MKKKRKKYDLMTLMCVCVCTYLKSSNSNTKKRDLYERFVWQNKFEIPANLTSKWNVTPHYGFQIQWSVISTYFYCSYKEHIRTRRTHSDQNRRNVKNCIRINFMRSYFYFVLSLCLTHSAYYYFIQRISVLLWYFLKFTSLLFNSLLLRVFLVWMRWKSIFL